MACGSQHSFLPSSARESSLLMDSGLSDHLRAAKGTAVSATNGSLAVLCAYDNRTGIQDRHTRLAAALLLVMCVCVCVAHLGSTSSASSAIRSALTDLGMLTHPFCCPHRTSTCDTRTNTLTLLCTRQHLSSSTGQQAQPMW